MFVNSDKYETQMNTYFKLIVSTVLLVHKDFEIETTQSRNLGNEIADERITFETLIA